MVSIASRTTLWKTDPAHTLVEFSAKHMMVTTVKGQFKKVDAQVNWDEADITNSSVEATIDATSLISGEDRRDGHLRSADFLDAENHSIITFKSKRIEPKGHDEYRIIGDLTIRDVTKEVALDTTFEGRAKSPWGMEIAAFAAKTAINRKDFGLTWNVALETGGWLVGDTIKIEINTELVKQQEA
jgi:polyisoprenoid-binding protein YceI